MNMKHFDLKNNDKITTGFKTPSDYFEQFEVKMMRQISTEKPVEKEVKVVPFFYRKQIWISSIAALILLAITIPVYFNMANENNLDATTIESYLAQQSVGTRELTKHLTDEDIASLEISLNISASENDAIENYLLESENLDYILNE